MQLQESEFAKDINTDHGLLHAKDTDHEHLYSQLKGQSGWRPSKDN